MQDMHIAHHPYGLTSIDDNAFDIVGVPKDAPS